jgi:hypothetical protein
MHTLRFLLLVSGATLGVSLNLIKVGWSDHQRQRSWINWSNPLRLFRTELSFLVVILSASFILFWQLLRLLRVIV